MCVASAIKDSATAVGLTKSRCTTAVAESLVVFTTHTDGVCPSPFFTTLITSDPVCVGGECNKGFGTTAVAESFVAFSTHTDGSVLRNNPGYILLVCRPKKSSSNLLLPTAVAECLVALATHTDEVCPSSFCRHQQPNATQPLTKMAVGLLIVILLVLQCDRERLQPRLRRGSVKGRRA